MVEAYNSSKRTEGPVGIALSSVIRRIIWICMLPFFLFAAGVAFYQIDRTKHQQNDQAAVLADNFLLKTENSLNERISALQMLAASPLVDDFSKWNELYQQALGFYKNFDNHVVITDGRTPPKLLLDTRVPFGTPLPMVEKPKGRLAGPIAMQTGKPAVSDIFLGPIVNNYILGIAVPVVRDGKAQYAILTTIEKSIFQKNLEYVKLPSGWTIILKDASGDTIASLPQNIINPPYKTYVVNSRISNWTVSVVISRYSYWAPLVLTGISFGVAVLGLTLLGFLGGQWTGRRLGNSISSLVTEPAQEEHLYEIIEINAVRQVLYDETHKRSIAEETLRKSLENLTESERRYRALFENMTAGFVLFEVVQNNQNVPVDLVILAANGRFEATTGLKASEVIGKRLTHVLPGIEKDTADWIGKYGMVALTGEPQQFEQGSELLGVFFYVTAYQAGPKQCGVAFQEITERKKAEEALRESETRLKLVLDGSKLGFWDWNIETGEVVRNTRWAEMLGYTLEEIEFTVEQWTDLHHPDDREFAWKSLQDHLEGRTSAYKVEYRMHTKDGQYKWILDQAGIVSWDAQGKPLRVCGTHTDITELKLAELEREKLQAQLNQAQKMESVGRLAGGVAHDFNNMLGVILGYTEMALQEVDPSTPLHEDLYEIYKAGKRSADITQQLLAFARKQTIQPTILDLNETIESLLKMLQRLIGEDIDLVWLPGTGLGKIKMDQSQLDQLLANLCVNSRDAIKGVGKVTVETGMVTFDEDYCANHEGSTPGVFILLSVSDDGCGMDKETINKIFEPFFTTKEVGKGTGLGLATVYGIVRQNNGFINVYSEPGDGTTFNIYLPVYKSDIGEIKSRTVSDIPSGGNETILIVEDEALVLKLAKSMLERLGYTVLTAKATSDAIQLAEDNANKIHLLITDVVLPGMNGRDLSGHLHSLYPNIKTLFMSGYTANVIAHRGILDDGVLFIPKPFSIQNLAVKVREALEQE